MFDETNRQICRASGEASKDQFKQEYAYVEDFYLYEKPPEQKKEKPKEQRGYVEIDMGNGEEKD